MAPVAPSSRGKTRGRREPATAISWWWPRRSTREGRRSGPPTASSSPTGTRRHRGCSPTARAARSSTWGGDVLLLTDRAAPCPPRPATRHRGTASVDRPRFPALPRADRPLTASSASWSTMERGASSCTGGGLTATRARRRDRHLRAARQRQRLPAPRCFRRSLRHADRRARSRGSRRQPDLHADDRQRRPGASDAGGGQRRDPARHEPACRHAEPGHVRPVGRVLQSRDDRCRLQREGHLPGASLGADRPHHEHDRRGVEHHGSRTRPTTTPRSTPPSCRRREPPPTSFYTVTPCRILDTRDPDGPSAGRRFTGSNVVNVAGLCGIPRSALSASANLTVTESTGPGHVTLLLPVRAAADRLDLELRRWPDPRQQRRGGHQRRGADRGLRRT